MSHNEMNEKVMKFVKTHFFKKDYILLRRSFIFTFLIGLMAHGFIFLNLSISHDALFNFYNTRSAHQHQIGLGRIMEPVYREMTATGLLLPWSTGITALFWLGLAVFLVCRMFRLFRRTEVLMIAGIMTANISVTAIAATYTPWFAVDMFALLLAVIGDACWYGFISEKQKCFLVPGVLAICGSLSLYQCYFAVTVVIMILLSMQGLMKQNSAARVFKDGLIGIAMLMVGGSLYYVLLKISCSIQGTQLITGDYDSLTNLWNNKESISQRIIYCFKEGMGHFFAKDENIYPYPVIWVVNGVLFLLCLYFIFCLMEKRKTPFRVGGGKTGMDVVYSAGCNTAFCSKYDAPSKYICTRFDDICNLDIVSCTDPIMEMDLCKA